MEPLNLHQLSLVLDQELYIIPGDIQNHQQANNLAEKHGHLVDINPKGMDKALGETSDPKMTKDELEEEPIKIDFEGNYDKGVLILYQGSDLDASSREFLMKIMGAVGCSLKDVALMSGKQIQEYPPESFSQLNPLKCLVFGTINHPLMQQKQVEYEIISGDTLILFANDLKEIAESTPLKKKLWASLQILFNINK